MKPTAVGLTWYRREEDFVRLKAMSKDSEEFPDTYDEWLEDAKNVLGTLKLQGLNVVKVYLDPETFSAWCKAKGYEMDGVARSRYATDFAAGKI